MTPTEASLSVALLAAICAGLVTLAALPTITALSRPRWNRDASMRAFLSAAGAGGAPALAAAVLGAIPPHVLLWAVVGTLVHLTLLWIRFAPLRRVKALTFDLTQPAKRDDALRAIGPALDRSRPRATEGAQLSAWAQAVIVAAAHVVDADEPTHARTVLERTRGLRYLGASASNLGLLWTHVELFSGNLGKARDVLRSVPRPSPTALIESYAEALDIVVAAVSGEHERALARLAAWKHPETWHEKLRLAARRTVHAARGEDEACARLDAEIDRRFGPGALAAIRRLAAIEP